MKKFLTLAILPIAFTACGGASHSGTSNGLVAPEAHALVYSNPSSSDWRLVQHPTSTPTHLILSLVGPSSTRCRGAAFTLKSDASKISFGRINGEYIEDAGLLELAVDPSDPNEPRLMVGGVKGDALMVGAFQKDRNISAKTMGPDVFRIAIDFKQGAGLKSGDTIPFTVVKARMLGDDLSSSPISEINIAVGTLNAR